MTTTLVHVYQQRISKNLKVAPEDRLPPIIVRSGRNREYGTEVEIDGPSRIIYRPDAPLDCGARLWIETDGEVRVIH